MEQNERLNQIQITKNFSIREFFNMNGKTAVACNRNWEGSKTPCIKFGTVCAVISKNCGASAKQVFAEPENYQVIQLHDDVNGTDFYRVAKVGNSYYSDVEALTL